MFILCSIDVSSAREPELVDQSPDTTSYLPITTEEVVSGNNLSKTSADVTVGGVVGGIVAGVLVVVVVLTVLLVILGRRRKHRSQEKEDVYNAGYGRGRHIGAPILIINSSNFSSKLRDGTDTTTLSACTEG